MQMKQVMNHNKDYGLLNMIRRTDTMICEKEHYPIGKPTVAQLIQLSLEEKNMSQ